MALGLCVSIGWSQPVPDTIQLPDSLGPLRPGYHLAFGSSTNNIYVASESSDIIVVDGETFQRIKRINTGTPIGGALLVSQHNRLYCSYPQQGRIGVIDCATNSIVDSIQVGTRPTLLCYSSGSDKLYCGDTIDCTVSVINCVTNAVLKVIPVGESLSAMAYDPTTNKAYASNRDALLAISCSADSIVATISAIKAARGLCLNKRRQKLYVVPPDNGGPDTVFVVSTPADSVVARMPCWPELGPLLACNEATDRLYGTPGVDLCEFDCVGDTVVRYAPVDGVQPVGLVCDSVHNRLYYLGEVNEGGWLYMLDCVTLDVISWTPTQLNPVVLQADPARYRIMCAGGGSPWRVASATLVVFDYKGDSLYVGGGVPLSGWEQVMCHNPVTGRLYYWWGPGVGGLGVIDEQTSRVVAQAFLPGATLYQMAHSRTSNKLYFRDGSRLGVMDGLRDSLLKDIEIFEGCSGYPCWCPDENKVYCSAYAGERRYIAAVDCYTDSVVREIDVYGGVERFEYLGEGRMLCVRYQGLTLIDCRTDSVLADTAIEGGTYAAAAHTGDGKKVYVTRYGWLQVRNSSTLSLLATIDWPYGGLHGGGSLIYSDTTHKLYWFSDEGDSMLAIDATSDTVVARIATAASRALSCFDQTGRYLFCFSNYLRVYDTQTDRLVAVCPLSLPPLSVTPNPDQGCIYVGCKDVILVYPDAPPGVCEQPAVSAWPKVPRQTVVHGVLFLPEASGPKPQAASLMDATGRKVLDLKRGANDVRTFAPGVYFVRETQAQAEAQAVRKVVIAR